MRHILLVVCLAAGQAPAPQPVDPALTTVVEQFFATQQAEDAAAFLSLWSSSGKPPTAEQLRSTFDSGDDRFDAVNVLSASVRGDRAIVIVSITRERTDARTPDASGAPRVFTTRLQLALTLVREATGWKIVREGPIAAEMAAALMSEQDPAARAELLKSADDVVAVRLQYELLRNGDPLARQGRLKEALEYYERALEVTRARGDKKGEGQVLQSIGTSFYFKRDFASALRNYESRLALERAIANDEGIAAALLGVATVKYSTHDYSAALPLYREALAIHEKREDEPGIADTLISVGNILYLQGDYDGAIDEYRRAEILKRKTFDFGGAAAALQGLGRTYAAQGDLSAALLAFSGVLDDSRKRRDVVREATALQNIGDTHFRLGNIDAARAAYDESRTKYEKAGDLANAGRVMQSSALVELVAARFTLAESAYSKSQAICSGIAPEPDAECTARAHVGLGFAQAAQEKYIPAIVAYRKGILAFEALNQKEPAARARIGLSEALIGKEDYKGAIAEATLARLPSDDILWRALVSQSRAERRLARGPDALGTARAAVQTVQAMAEAALRRPGQAAPRDSTIAFVNVAVLQAEAGDPAAVWRAVEQMRAHQLRGAIAANERDIAAGMTDEEKAAERKIAAELTTLYGQLDREKTLPKPDPERLKRLDAAIAAGAAKRAAWLQELFTRHPALRTWRGLNPAAAAEDIDTLLTAPGEMAVQLVVDDRDLLVLTAERADEGTRLDVAVVPVKRQQLAERVAAATSPTALADAAAWRKSSADLFALLPSEVVSRLAKARRVTVMPDDMLWRVPFEAMPIGAGYLTDSALVTYAPSVTSLLRGAPRVTASSAGAPGLVVAAPTLASPVIEALKTSAPSWTLRDTDAAAQESSRVSATYGDRPPVQLSGAEATEEAVRKAASQAAWLHIAAPFRLNAASPLFSAVLLAQPAADAASPPVSSTNGFLEAREIPTAASAATLAVFSDPASLSMRDATLAIPAFHWIWRAGGADTLIVRRWAHDERGAQEVVEKFYQALKDGVRPAEAMRAAAQALRRAEDPAPPSVWAGWLVLGAR